MNNVRPLKPRQVTALQLLATGTPAYKVAERLEITTMTLYRWQRLPEFEAKLRVITDSGLEEIAKKLNATALTAVETLQEILCDLTQPVPIRMKAAIGVLNAMPAVNGSLEKSLQHRAADFNLAHRFGSFTYNGGGEPYKFSGESSITL